jgi:hypothetical protein
MVCMKGFGVVGREKADRGLLITMQEPTQPRRAKAASAGFYSSPGWNKGYPRMQLLTVKERLAGKGSDHPPANVTFAQAPQAPAPQAVSRRLPWDATHAAQAAR